ncbi:Uncharacterised protein [uncultured archaeon]|nr:Uncharacterised protein [uncultured archaeon]
MGASDTSARIVREWMTKEILHDDNIVVASVVELGKNGDADTLSNLYAHQLFANSELKPIRAELIKAYKTGEPSEIVGGIADALFEKEKKLPFSRGVMSAAKRELSVLEARKKIKV